jgi:hypothetical protein
MDLQLQGKSVLITGNVTGCGGWTRPNTSEAEFNQDRYGCEREAISMYPVAMRPTTAVHQSPVQTNCTPIGQTVSCPTIRVAPTQGVPYDSNALARSNAVRSCLQGRGYVRR